MHRRQFLEAMSLAGISVAAPFAAANSTTPPTNAAHRHLVLIELNGGNDGLNCVIPYRESTYQALRPTIGIKTDQVIQLDDTLGLNPALEPLQKLWIDNDFALINGVGYAEPNRSHFRSIEIWETASDANETLIDGWLKPIAQALPSINDSGVKAIALANDHGPLAGDIDHTVVFDNLSRFIQQAKRLRTSQAESTIPALQHVLKVQRATQKVARDFATSLEDMPAQADDFPGNQFGRQLGMIAHLMQSGGGPQIYKVSLGSFDTHANQRGNHNRLLRNLAAGVEALRNNLHKAGLWDKVLVMTYSEFGRRAKENASHGTDHGTAAAQFVFGGGVKGGMYGEQPGLDKLVEGDLEYKVDFRSVYHTVAYDWLQQRNLPGRLTGYDRLGFVS